MNVRLSVLVVTLISITALHAQDVEWTSNTVIGGSMSYNKQFFGDDMNSFFEDQSSWSLSFSPYLAKELSPRTMLGIRPAYRYSKTTFTSSSPIEPEPFISSFVSRSVGVGLFLRHMLNVEGRFRFYLEYEAGYEASVQKFEDMVQDRGNITSVGVAPGLYYLLSSRFRILLRGQGLTYGIQKGENSPASRFLNVDLSFESLQFGAEYVF